MIERMAADGYYGHTRDEILAIVPDGVKRALDVGCAEGAFGRHLGEQTGAEVWGIEPCEEPARVAAGVLERVIELPVEEAIDELPDGSFDLIVFNDSLEHFAWPEPCFERLKSKLAPGGHFLLSIPNMRFYKVLLGLVLKGEWEYTDEGVLDRTHLRFFTRKSMARMFERLDCEVLEVIPVNRRNRLWLKALSALTLGATEDLRSMQFGWLVRPRRPHAPPR
jgi:2-polyprenyl-3-methyl-5-hydroxy-6-metoxy-1,4-benzoquinol methylase